MRKIAKLPSGTLKNLPIAFFISIGVWRNWRHYVRHRTEFVRPRTHDAKHIE
jgi:hypothetical protein